MVSRRLLYFYCERGDDVKDFQDAVNAVRDLPRQASAFDPIMVDGIFGSNSLKRAREFQNINGLTVDGLVGDGTWGELLALMRGLIRADRPGGGAGGGQTKGSGKQAFGKPLPQKLGGNPGGYKQEGYKQGGYKQGGYKQDGYKQDGYKQDGYKQGGYKQEGYKQDGYKQGGYKQEGYKQDGDSKNEFDPFGQKTAPGSQKVSSW